MGGGLRVAQADDEWAVATRPGLFLSVWRGKVKPSHVEHLERVLPRLVEESPEGRYAAITVIEPTIELPFDDEARRLSTRLQARFASHMICQAYLVEGSGFLPATVRTLTAGLSLMNRSPYKTKVFSEPGPLVSWLVPQVDFSPAELEAAIAHTRAS